MDRHHRYHIEDIVWVKLTSAIWWPGKVVNMELFQDTLLKRVKNKPLMIVEFFDRTYQLVNDWKNVVPYNWKGKTILIKVAMKLYMSKTRNVPAKMLYYPGHIIRAENLSGGDTDEIARVMFDLPPNYKMPLNQYKCFIRLQNKPTLQIPHVDPDVFLSNDYTCADCYMCLINKDKDNQCSNHAAHRNDILFSVRMLRQYSRCKFFCRGEVFYCGYCPFSSNYRGYERMNRHLAVHQTEMLKENNDCIKMYLARMHWDRVHRSEKSLFWTKN